MPLGYYSLALERANYTQNVYKSLINSITNKRDLQRHLNLLSVDLVQAFEIYYKAVLVKLNDLDNNATDADINNSNVKDVYMKLALKALLNSHNLADLEKSVTPPYKLFTARRDLLNNIKGVYFCNRYKADSTVNVINFSSYFSILRTMKLNLKSLYNIQPDKYYNCSYKDMDRIKIINELKSLSGRELSARVSELKTIVQKEIDDIQERFVSSGHDMSLLNELKVVTSFREEIYQLNNKINKVCI